MGLSLHANNCYFFFSFPNINIQGGLPPPIRSYDEILWKRVLTFRNFELIKKGDNYVDLSIEIHTYFKNLIKGEDALVSAIYLADQIRWLPWQRGMILD